MSTTSTSTTTDSPVAGTATDTTAAETPRRVRRRRKGREIILPALPSPLDADDREILLWLHEQPREAVVTPPAGFAYGHMAACRRKLIRLGLATLDCPPGDRPTVYLLTAAGEAAAVAERERRTPRKRRGPMRGRSKVDAAA